MMTDFRVELKVRNGRILRRMNAAGIFTVSELCRLMGRPTAMSQVGEIVNLKKTPFNNAGQWRRVVLEIAEALNCMPDDLFSPAQREMRLKSNKGYLEASETEVNLLLENQHKAATPPDLLIERQEAMEGLDEALAGLSVREERVLRQRYGFDGEPMTLEEIAQIDGTTRERVRQIILRGERKLKHPAHEKKLHECLEQIMAEGRN